MYYHKTWYSIPSFILEVKGKLSNSGERRDGKGAI